MAIIWRLCLLLASANAFTAITLSRNPFAESRNHAQPLSAKRAPLQPMALRGGSKGVQASMVSAVTAAVAGPMALPTAAGIATVACMLAYIHQAYIFSLSYGLAMAGIGGAVLLTSPTSLTLKVHAGLVASYGVRLFAFLLWRQKLQPSYNGTEKLKALDKTPPLQRTPIILWTAFFYALMSSPLLYHLKAAPLVGVGALVSQIGSALAATGLLYEAIADQQKSFFKMKLRAENKEDTLYTSGLYATSRHANYFGEMVFWAGSFVAGAPALVAPGVSLGVRARRLVCSTLGLAGIFFIMLSATKRLEGKQAAKYRPAAWFDNYYLGSNALFPRLM